jgi:hypothetical protein
MPIAKAELYAPGLHITLPIRGENEGGIVGIVYAFTRSFNNSQ